MIAAIAALAIGLAPTMEFAPSDDVWVYPHASDPQKDGYLRVWGVGGQSVATDPTQADEYSYSYLKFDLSKLPKEARVSSAVLTLTHTADPTWQVSDAKAAPLEARVLAKDFTEKSWEFGLAKTIFPTSGKTALLGTAAPAKIEAGKPVQFELELAKGEAKFTPNADRTLTIALTSTLDPSAIGNRAVYKFFSKDYDKVEYRPKLVVTYE